LTGDRRGENGAGGSVAPRQNLRFSRRRSGKAGPENLRFCRLAPLRRACRPGTLWGLCPHTPARGFALWTPIAQGQRPCALPKGLRPSGHPACKGTASPCSPCCAIRTARRFHHFFSRQNKAAPTANTAHSFAIDAVLVPPAVDLLRPK